jgi:hypothetical protein
MTTADKPAQPSGLDNLAGQAQVELAGGPIAAPGAPDGQPVDSEEARRQQEQLEAGVQKVLVGLLKMARQAIAKRVPEIREEWTDEALEAPAAAAMPLVRKYMGKLFEKIGSDPELATFVVACIPLGMGLYDAFDRAQLRIEREERKGGPAAPPLADGAAE